MFSRDLTPMFSRFIACIIAASFGFCIPASGEIYPQIHIGAFSPDGSKLSMRYCNKESVCRVGFVDLKRDRFEAILPIDKDQIWNPGGFSPDGQKMVVAVRRRSEKGMFSQIGIVSMNNLRFTQLTNGNGYKTAPNFSRDGKKIIFVQANRERSSGATRLVDWDVYEISVNGSGEQRLTDYNFYQISPPEYLPGDRQFIFSGSSPRAYKALPGEEGDRHTYKAKYRDNCIFVLPVDQSLQQLRPVFSNGEFSDYPSISADGSTILYRARSDKEDGIKTKFTYDLFLFAGKTHRRMTRMEGQVSESVLSPKGDQAAFVSEKYDKPRQFEIYILNIRSGQVKKLNPKTEN